MEDSIARKNLIIVENAPAPGVRAPTIRRFIPVREIVKQKQVAPPPAPVQEIFDPFWSLPALADEFKEPARSLFSQDGPLALGRLVLAGIVIVDLVLVLFLAISISGVLGTGSPVPFDVAGIFAILVTLAMRIGIPLVLATVLALAGIVLKRLLDPT